MEDASNIQNLLIPSQGKTTRDQKANAKFLKPFMDDANTTKWVAKTLQVSCVPIYTDYPEEC